MEDCNQVVEANRGNVYGYSENYQFSNKNTRVNKKTVKWPLM